MKKLPILTLVVAVAIAASSAFAGDKACCGAQTSNQMAKGMCAASFAKLDLTPAQKSKMESLAAECDKAGCTKESMAKMEKGAKRILSKEQYANWKACCSGQMGSKA